MSPVVAKGLLGHNCPWLKITVLAPQGASVQEGGPRFMCAHTLVCVSENLDSELFMESKSRKAPREVALAMHPTVLSVVQ